MNTCFWKWNLFFRQLDRNKFIDLVRKQFLSNFGRKQKIEEHQYIMVLVYTGQPDAPTRLCDLVRYCSGQRNTVLIIFYSEKHLFKLKTVFSSRTHANMCARVWASLNNNKRPPRPHWYPPGRSLDTESKTQLYDSTLFGPVDWSLA